MAASVSMKVSSRPRKIPKLDNPGEESKPTTKYGRLRRGDPESDEYMRQYLLFYYDFHRTQGFGIQWDKIDFFFRQSKPCDGAPRFCGNQTNEELIEEKAVGAIAKYNKENGTNLVFVELIEANYAANSYVEFWITFRAKDMSSLSQESKIYQANVRTRTAAFLIPIFRVKPTDEEMAANPIHVDPPIPYRFDCSKPPVVFSFAGPGEDPVRGTPFVFNRNPPPPEEEEDDSETELDIEDESENSLNQASTIA